MAVTAKERRELLDRVGMHDASRTQRGPSLAHRRAVLAGAPTQLPHASGRQAALGPLGRKPKTESALEFQARARKVAFGWAKRVGTGRVRFAYPGAAGHEKCSDVCVTYG